MVVRIKESDMCVCVCLICLSAKSCIICFMQKKPQVHRLPAEDESIGALKRILDRRERELLAVQRGMTQCATVLLSISAPLSASRPSSGMPAALSAAAVLAAALSLLAGLVLLHAPARQSQAVLRTVLGEPASLAGHRSVRRVVQTPGLSWWESLCDRLQPSALVASVAMLATSAILAAL